MSELSPEARALIDAARGGDEPRPADKERVRAAVFAAIGLAPEAADAAAHEPHGSDLQAGDPGAAPGESFTSATTVSGSAMPVGGKLLSLKILAGVVIVGGLSLGGYMLARHGGEPAPAPVAAPAPVDVRTAEEPPGPVPPVPAAAPGAEDSDEVEIEMEVEVVAEPEPPSRKPARPRERRARSQERTSEQPREAGGADTLAALREEHKLIARAKQALDEDAVERALSLLATHGERFPDGALSEERAALRVVALCQLGDRDRARRERARFLATWPRSPHAGRVSRTCGE